MKLSIVLFLATLHGACSACDEKATSTTSLASNANANLRGVSASSSQERRLIGQPGCFSPTKMGALRNWEDRSQCLNVRGTSGVGNVDTFFCDTRSDQVWHFCEDGTIRNEESQFCLAQTGRRNVGTAPCTDSPQIWEVINIERGVVDSTSGIEQIRFQLRHKATGKCLDVNGNDGSGGVGMFDCRNENDQYWHFRNTGQAIVTGAFENRRSEHCIDVSGCDRSGNVFTSECEAKMDQIWTYYENGELVNRQSNRCLDVLGTNGFGNIETFFCENKEDQMWDRIDMCDGRIVLKNKLSGQCLDVDGLDGTGSIHTGSCTSTDNQEWSIIPENVALGEELTTFGSVRGVWVQEGCALNGADELSLEITESIVTTRSMTEEFGLSVGVTIEAGFAIGGATGSLSTSVETSFTLSEQWSVAQSTAVTRRASCAVPTGGGICLYQFSIELEDNVDPDGMVTWNPFIFTCENEVPRCAPWDMCDDEECSECVSVL